jgi:hypothetical protein
MIAFDTDVKQLRLKLPTDWESYAWMGHLQKAAAAQNSSPV